MIDSLHLSTGNKPTREVHPLQHTQLPEHHHWCAGKHMGSSTLHLWPFNKRSYTTSEGGVPSQSVCPWTCKKDTPSPLQGGSLFTNWELPTKWATGDSYVWGLSETLERICAACDIHSSMYPEAYPNQNKATTRRRQERVACLDHL